MKFDDGSRAHRRAAMYGVLSFSAICASCSAGMKPYSMEMMPPPSIYETGVISSPDERHTELRDGIVQLPYATPRQPAGTGDAPEGRRSSAPASKKFRTQHTGLKGVRIPTQKPRK